MDIASKRIITELIGHQSEVVRIGTFSNESMFFTLDLSGRIHVSFVFTYHSDLG